MTGLLRADWIRLRRRYDLWIVLAGVLALAVVSYLSGSASAFNSQGWTPEPIDPSLPPEVQAQIAAMNAQIAGQMDAVRVLYLFPRSIVTILQQGTWLFMAAAFITASWIGSEFDWGTIRNVFLVRPERGRFLAARLASVIGITTIALGLTGLLGAILPVLTGIGAGLAAPDVPPQAIALAAVGAWVWTLAFIAVAALAAVLTRSPIFALILTAGYFLLEGLITSLPAWKGSALEGLRSVFFGVRLTGLSADLRTASGLADPSGVPAPARDLDPLLGLVIVAAWIGLAFGLSYLVLRRADIRE